MKILPTLLLHVHIINNQSTVPPFPSSLAIKILNLNKDYHVSPMGIETLGSYGPHALNFIKDIGRRIMDISGEKGPLPI